MGRSKGTRHSLGTVLLAPALLVCSAALHAQSAPASPPAATPPTPTVSAGPIAIVPVSNGAPGEAAVVTGALEVTNGKVMIGTSGSITSGSRTTDVTLPRRGTLRVCPSTTVKLAADSGAPAGTTPGLLMAMDRGAVEMSFATTQGPSNADILLTPDFRILMNGPGASEVKVRLGANGDTCVDNSGLNAPYIVVTSLFESGLYRVQPGQRVMFQHGSLREVVDSEKEPCGCPPTPAKKASNEFPLAQSEGLEPSPAPAPAPPHAAGSVAQAPLVYSAREHAPTAVIPKPMPAPAQPAAAAPAPSEPAHKAAKKKRGFFVRVGHFFKRFFGAD
ncbi:MAG: hypothetical protein ACLGPM_12035 [Acidobacteriota bacterium]